MTHFDFCVRSVCIALTSVLCVGATSASADTLVLSWDPNPEPDVVGYMLHVGTQSGWYTQTVDTGMTTSYTWWGATAGQRYCFALSAYIAGYLEGPKSSEVCGYSNQYPVLASPESRVSTRSQATDLQLQGSDPDGQPVSYTATGLPEGLWLMPWTGYISGTPTTSGTFTVTITVSDGVLTSSQTFPWVITETETSSGWNPEEGSTVPSNTVSSMPSGTGLSGNYYSGLFESFLTTRVEAVDFTWGYDAPAPAVPADYFSVQWTGQLVAPVTGYYTFATVSDDGVRLWVDNQWLIDNWVDHVTTTDISRSIYLEAGQWYPVRVDFYDNGGGAVMQLLWAPPDQGYEVIPQSALTP